MFCALALGVNRLFFSNGFCWLAVAAPAGTLMPTLALTTLTKSEPELADVFSRARLLLLIGWVFFCRLEEWVAAMYPAILGTGRPTDDCCYFVV